MDKLSAKIGMPFGAETMENDPCTVETTRNYNAKGQANHFRASQGAEPAGFSAQNSSAEVKLDMNLKAQRGYITEVSSKSKS